MHVFYHLVICVLGFSSACHFVLLLNSIRREAEMSVRGKHEGQRFEYQDSATYA